MQVGDLVKVKDYDTDLVGIVLERKICGRTPNVAVRWFGAAIEVQWEPVSWLEVISASR
jgi:hypothetical protein